MNKQELYNLVFEDGQKYTDFYFNKRRNKLITYEKIIDNETAALVGVVDINLTSNNSTYKTALITGVCTAPNMRQKGIMHNLINEVLDDLKKQNYKFALLSPANKDYYKKFGFEPLILGESIKIYYTKNLIFSTKKASKIDTNLLLSLYHNISKDYKVCQQLNENIILDLIQDCTFDNSNIQIVYNQDMPVGWFVKDNDRIEIIVMKDYDIFNYIKHLDGLTYFKNDINGQKELFQIKYLDESLPHFDLNNTLIINKY